MNKTYYLRHYYILILVCLFLPACTLRSFHPTPVDALTEIPGMVVGSLNDASSIQILQQQAVAEGMVLLYRWQRTDMRNTNAFCFAATFVTPEGRGWRAQSSGYFSEVPSGHTRCTFTTRSEFEAGYYVGGNITDLTTAYGLSSRGSHVRITWSDGVVSRVPLQNNSFLTARPEILQVERIELLDTDDTVLEIEGF